MLNIYNGNIRKTILSTFPDSGLDIHEFCKCIYPVYLFFFALSTILCVFFYNFINLAVRDSINRQKQVLEDIAKSRNFDATKEPHKWYTVSKIEFFAIPVCNTQLQLIVQTNGLQKSTLSK